MKNFLKVIFLSLIIISNSYSEFPNVYSTIQYDSVGEPSPCKPNERFVNGKCIVPQICGTNEILNVLKNTCHKCPSNSKFNKKYQTCVCNNPNELSGFNTNGELKCFSCAKDSKLDKAKGALFGNICMCNDTSLRSVNLDNDTKCLKIPVFPNDKDFDKNIIISFDKQKKNLLYIKCPINSKKTGHDTCTCNDPKAELNYDKKGNLVCIKK